jgi:signal transduction histidine kinase
VVIVDGVRAVAGRHPVAVDVGLAVLVALADAPAMADTRAGIAGWSWFAAAHLPLVWRRSPVAVFWTVFAVALTVWTTVQAEASYPVVVILVAAYGLARHRSWRQLWPAVTAAGFALAVLWWRRELLGTDLMALTAILAATVLLGTTIRTRRAYTAELAERARRVEHDREQRARLAAAAERARIAREVHDVVTHNLSVVVALADGAALTAATAPERAADTLATVAATGRQALGEMQRLLDLLRDGDRAAGPLGLAPQPGLDGLDDLVEQVRAAGPTVALVRRGVPDGREPGVGPAVYRIVQEALTNTLKHAGPRATARVRLCHTTTGVDLEITDDGGRAGDRPPRDPPAGGHGLAGMAERAAAHGGGVEAGPLPGSGWRVHAWLRSDDGEAIT